MAMHPSGKIATSLAKDNTIRTWNLLKGRCAYTAHCSQGLWSEKPARN